MKSNVHSTKVYTLTVALTMHVACTTVGATRIFVLRPDSWFFHTTRLCTAVFTYLPAHGDSRFNAPSNFGSLLSVPPQPGPSSTWATRFSNASIILPATLGATAALMVA